MHTADRLVLGLQARLLAACGVAQSYWMILAGQFKPGQACTLYSHSPIEKQWAIWAWLSPGVRSSPTFWALRKRCWSERNHQHQLTIDFDKGAGSSGEKQMMCAFPVGTPGKCIRKSHVPQPRHLLSQISCVSIHVSHLKRIVTRRMTSMVY